MYSQLILVSCGVDGATHSKDLRGAGKQRWVVAGVAEHGPAYYCMLSNSGKIMQI